MKIYKHLFLIVLLFYVPTVSASDSLYDSIANTLDKLADFAVENCANCIIQTAQADTSVKVPIIHKKADPKVKMVNGVYPAGSCIYCHSGYY